MKKTDLLIWIPAVIGVLLLLVSYIDLQQLNAGNIEPRAMLGREIPFVLSGVLSSIIIGIIFLVYLFKKKWGKAIQSIFSVLLFTVCFILGGVLGAAYLNAT